MTALSANKTRPVKLPAGGVTTAEIKLAGYTNYSGGSTGFTCYKGAVMMCDIDDTDGYFAPKAANAASGDIFGGIAMEKVVVGSSDTGDGSKKLTVARDGIWGFAKGSLAITDIGAAVYASDSDAVTTTDTNNLWIGYIVDVDDTYAWVDIEPAFMHTNSAT